MTLQNFLYFFASLPIFCTSLALAFGPDFSSSSLPKLYGGPELINLETDRRLPTKIFLPLQYQSQEPSKKWPVVVLLHGFTGTGEGQDQYFTLSYRVSLNGFILVVPEGTANSAGTKSNWGADIGGKQFWNATDVCCDFAKTGVDDVAYIKSVLASVKNSYRVDERKIFLFGHSNGGFMANRMACEIGQEISAIAVLGGGTFKSPENCKNQDPIRYLQVHAVDDTTIQFQGAAEYAGALEAVNQWTVRNNCGTKLVREGKADFVALIPGVDTYQMAWNKCRSGKEVKLWRIRRYKTQLHEPHVPLFNLGFTEAVLNFFLNPK